MWSHESDESDFDKGNLKLIPIQCVLNYVHLCCRNRQNAGGFSL